MNLKNFIIPDLHPRYDILDLPKIKNFWENEKLIKDITFPTNCMLDILHRSCSDNVYINDNRLRNKFKAIIVDFYEYVNKNCDQKILSDNNYYHYRSNFNSYHIFNPNCVNVKIVQGDYLEKFLHLLVQILGTNETLVTRCYDIIRIILNYNPICTKLDSALSRLYNSGRSVNIKKGITDIFVEYGYVDDYDISDENIKLLKQMTLNTIRNKKIIIPNYYPKILLRNK